jgi:hypothetical protein
MACYHKFYNINDLNGLLPTWKCRTLIIGTFNPENKFHPQNSANFFYQRSKNYFWDIFPKLSDQESIEKNDTKAQIDHLKTFEIGITDLLLSIEDADIFNREHLTRISTVLDTDIERFESLNWNTGNIIDFLNSSKIEAVFFTKLGDANTVNVGINTFEYQMRLIENHCQSNNIFSARLHTPTGMGLGRGKRIPTLLDRWIYSNGADKKYFIK